MDKRMSWPNKDGTITHLMPNGQMWREGPYVAYNEIWFAHQDQFGNRYPVDSVKVVEVDKNGQSRSDA